MAVVPVHLAQGLFLPPDTWQTANQNMALHSPRHCPYQPAGHVTPKDSDLFESQPGARGERGLWLVWESSLNKCPGKPTECFDTSPPLEELFLLGIK